MEKVLQAVHNYFFAEEEQTAVNGLWFYGALGFMAFLAVLVFVVGFITG
jgi:hypothetical protein